MIELWEVEDTVENGILYSNESQARHEEYFLTVDVAGEFVLVRKGSRYHFLSCLHRDFAGKYKARAIEQINLHRDTDD